MAAISAALQGVSVSHLPVIVGFGGINPAGRSSFHHAYRRMVIDHLPQEEARLTLLNLAVLMGLVRRQETGWCTSHGEPIDPDQYLAQQRDSILGGTLIRKLEKN